MSRRHSKPAPQYVSQQLDLGALLNSSEEDNGFAKDNGFVEDNRSELSDDVFGAGPAVDRKATRRPPIIELSPDPFQFRQALVADLRQPQYQYQHPYPPENRPNSRPQQHQQPTRHAPQPKYQAQAQTLTQPEPTTLITTDLAGRKKPIESRIEFVRDILHGKTLRSMVDFDDASTESMNDMRLNKKIIDARNLFMSMNVKLRYLKSGTTGHTFKAISKDGSGREFAVKVCAYPKDNYGAMNNLRRPENAELRMLKLLSNFVIRRGTPHFVLPIGTFNTSITNFIRVPKNVIDIDDPRNEMYRIFVERYHDNEFEDFVSVLISEWCNGGDLLDYVRHNYRTMTLRTWKVIFFQILFTLTVIHDQYPSFRHNDLKANNVLIELTDIEGPDKAFRYHMDDVCFTIPNENIQTKIWDFDFACIGGLIENNKVNSRWTKKLNITRDRNMYYDMHYFFSTLSSERFFKHFRDGGAPPEIVEFVDRIVPEYLSIGSPNVNRKGRLLYDIEYTTPYRVIMTDPLFKKYRSKVWLCVYAIDDTAKILVVSSLKLKLEPNHPDYGSY